MKNETPGARQDKGAELLCKLEWENVAEEVEKVRSENRRKEGDVRKYS